MATYVPFTFSEGGANRAVLTRKIWDKILHQRVQNKIFFKRFIGADSGHEGNIYDTTTAMPIVLKNDLERQPGDLITMQLINNIANDPGTSGVTGTEVLGGNEEELSFGYLKVPIDLFRKAVLIKGMMSFQRTPIALMNEAISQLSDSGAQVIDNNIFKTFYSGSSYNLYRSLGLTSVPPKNHPNIIFGSINNTTLSQLTSTMNFTTSLLEDLRVYVQVNNLNPVMVDGEPYFPVIIHPSQGKSLRESNGWLQAMQWAWERGKQNPIFQGSIGVYAGFIFFESNKIETVKNYAKITVSGTPATVSESTATTFTGTDPDGARFNGLDASVTQSRIHGAIVLGAHSVGWAYGRQWEQVRRKEDDYEELFGTGIRSIFGMKRADWTDVDAGTVYNQSSVIVYTYD